MSSAGSFLRLTFDGLASTGERLAILIRAYFDESDEGDSKRGFFVVGGYVFTGTKLKALEAEWRPMLKRYHLPYFHMNECNTNTGVYSHLTETECDQSARQAIAIAKRYPLLCLCLVLRRETYREIMEDQGFDCDPYTFLLWSTLLHTVRWRNEHRPKHDLALFFEKRQENQPRANELLQLVTKDRQVHQNARVASYSFFDKDASYPGQAADLITWHVRKANANIAAGKVIRKDTEAIFEGARFRAIHYTPEQLMTLRDQFIRSTGNLANASRVLFNPDGPYYFGSQQPK